MTMTNVKIDVTIKLTTQSKPDGKLLPAISAQDVKILIDKKHCFVKLKGKNVIVKVLSLFENKLNQIIIDQITPILITMLSEDIPKSINLKLMETNGFVTPFATFGAFEHLTFDFEVNQAP